MNTQSWIHLLVPSATVLSLTATTASAQFIEAADAVNNRAIAASPRAMEQYPSLARNAVSVTGERLVRLRR